MKARLFIGLGLALQVVCASLVAFDILASILGIGGPIPWSLHELIELSAALGLLIGIAMGGLALRAALRRTKRAEDRLRDASTAFHEVMEARFAEWGLTPAERDVALFALKGMSTAEIAGLRATSEGTVKAQSAAIYRKAGVANRAQLISVFVDHLIDGPPAAAAPEDADQRVSSRMSKSLSSIGAGSISRARVGETTSR